MGMIRVVFLFLIFLNSLHSFSQSSKDTVFFEGKPFIKHIVKTNNQLEYIANLYNVKVNDILEHNEVGAQLYYNQALYIPLFQKKKFNFFNNKKRFPSLRKNNNDTISISILLPFLIPENDTLVASFKDKNEASSIIYEKSKMALSFYQGLELTLDSLQKSGINAHIQVFDTRNDTLRVHQICQSKILDKSSIIIGPLFEKNLNIVCKYYGNDPLKKIISPLSKSTVPTKDNNSVYQINTPFKSQIDIIKRFILNRYKNRMICVYYDSLNYGKALYIKEIFKREKKIIHLHNIQHVNVDSIRLIANTDQCVIIPSYNNVYVSSILSTLGGIDSTFVVFGLNNWKTFKNLELENLMELDVHIADPFYFNDKNLFEQNFLRLYENKYKSASNRYAYVGFQVGVHFLLNQRIFTFRRLKPKSGYINIKAPILNYKNFELSKVN